MPGSSIFSFTFTQALLSCFHTLGNLQFYFEKFKNSIHVVHHTTIPCKYNDLNEMVTFCDVYQFIFFIIQSDT